VRCEMVWYQGPDKEMRVLVGRFYPKAWKVVSETYGELKFHPFFTLYSSSFFLGRVSLKVN